MTLGISVIKMAPTMEPLMDGYILIQELTEASILILVLTNVLLQKVKALNL